VARRNIIGLWDAIQTAGGRATIDIDTVRPDGTFTLEAQHSGGAVTGNGDGRFLDNDRQVHFTVNWNNNTQGAYIGAFDANGVLNGSTFDMKNPESHARWHSSRAFPL
jgi:hypothetical protein